MQWNQAEGWSAWQILRPLKRETLAVSTQLSVSGACIATSPLGHETETGFTEPKRSLAGQARLRVALRRYGAASFACIHERRMVDLTGIEPVTS